MLALYFYYRLKSNNASAPSICTQQRRMKPASDGKSSAKYHLDGIEIGVSVTLTGHGAQRAAPSEAKSASAVALRQALATPRGAASARESEISALLISLAKSGKCELSSTACGARRDIVVKKSRLAARRRGQRCRAGPGDQRPSAERAATASMLRPAAPGAGRAEGKARRRARGLYMQASRRRMAAG